MAIITASRTTPPLEFPIRVLTTSPPEPAGLKLLIPPATPPGDYSVEVVGRGPVGPFASTKLQVRVDAVTVAPAAAAARPPVILLNGLQLACGINPTSTLADSVRTFGQLASLLQNQDHVGVAFFNNCIYDNVSIEQLAGQLNNYLVGLKYTDGTPIDEVDLVVHSMGGLIARAYLSGKGQTSGVFSPPANHKVRKLITIATPHFGSFQAVNLGTQVSQMELGSQFLWDLGKWNQSTDDLRGVDALAIIGNAGNYGSTSNASDGVVSLTSGSLGFARPDERTRVVPYCHITPFFGSDLFMTCDNNHGIAEIDSEDHSTARIVRSFLADTTEWQSIGKPPSEDPFLANYAGALVALKDANDNYFTDLTSVTYGNGAWSLSSGPSNAVASIYYGEFIPAGVQDYLFTLSTGQKSTSNPYLFAAGSTTAIWVKPGPIIVNVQSTIMGLSGLTVASGANIIVNGIGFSGGGTQLRADGTALSISSLSDGLITAFLPSMKGGLVPLEVSNSNGQNTVNIMTAPAPEASIAMSAQAASLSAAAGGGSVSVAASAGLAWTAQSNSSWITLTAGASGTGPGTVTFSLQSNTGSERTGTITIAGQTFTVNQESATLPAGMAFAGSLAQIASAGGWDTTLTLVNLDSTSNAVRLSTYAGDGSMPLLPYTFPQQPAQGTTLGATFDETLAANASLVFNTTGLSTQGSVVGSAQFLATGNVGGFGIFQIQATGQQAVVPLETRNAPSYLLPFDYTNSLQTGLALASASATAGKVRVIVRDDTGAVIPTRVTSIPLGANGHVSFMLSDSTQGFPEVAGKRGTVEFDTTAGGRISVLGIRANGKAITTLPVLAQVGTSGGSLAHVATGGGWETLFTLVNAGTTTAQFTLSFYNEKTGMPLPLGLTFPQGGAAQSTANLTHTLAPGAALLVQTNGGSAAVTCSARLTTTGQVSGFAIFNYGPWGQEAVVPLETRSPGAFVLAFDNTGQLATGLALANLGNALVNVPVVVRDDTGATLASSQIQVAANGHTSFMLTDASLGYPATAGKRGTIEFDVPAGAKINALGIRAVSGANVITTIPVLAK